MLSNGLLWHLFPPSEDHLLTCAPSPPHLDPACIELRERILQPGLGNGLSLNVSPKDASECRPLGSGLGTATFRAHCSPADKSKPDLTALVETRYHKVQKELKCQTPIMHSDVFKVFWRQRASVTH